MCELPVAKYCGGRLTVKPWSFRGSRFSGEATTALVLVLDDDTTWISSLALYGRGVGIKVVGARKIDQAMSLAASLAPHWIVVDALLEDGESGLRAIRPLRSIAPSARLVVASGFANDVSAQVALAEGADAYFDKRDWQLLVSTIARGVGHEAA